MKSLLAIPLASMIFISCGTNSEESNQETDNRSDSSSVITDDFDSNEWKVNRGSIGKINLGMTLSETKEFTKDFKEKESEAALYGFGGGSPAYEYYKNEQLYFALLPELNSDTILFLIAIHPELKTTNGLGPKTEISRLQKEYRNMWVNQDLMSGGEFFHDSINNWTFYFATDSENQIGSYPELELPSAIINPEASSTWIVVK